MPLKTHWMLLFLKRIMYVMYKLYILYVSAVVVIVMCLFTGNMWGKCDNGTEGLGCGRPETFRNCADVRIVTSTSGLPPQFIHNRPQQLYFSSALRGGDLRIAPQIYYPLVVKYVARVPSICLSHLSSFTLFYTLLHCNTHPHT